MTVGASPTCLHNYVDCRPWSRPPQLHQTSFFMCVSVSPTCLRNCEVAVHDLADSARGFICSGCSKLVSVWLWAHRQRVLIAVWLPFMMASIAAAVWRMRLNPVLGFQYSEQNENEISRKCDGCAYCLYFWIIHYKWPNFMLFWY